MRSRRFWDEVPLKNEQEAINIGKWRPTDLPSPAPWKKVAFHATLLSTSQPKYSDAIYDNVATKADIQRLEARIDSDTQRLEGRIELIEHRLLMRLGSMIVAAAGILIAIHYIH